MLVASMQFTQSYKRTVQFIMNTADNFYADGCFADNATGVPQNQTCAVRIKTDWVSIPCRFC
jgi:hypothetical protein